MSNSIVKNVILTNVKDDVKKLLSTKPIRNFSDDFICNVKNDIANGMCDVEIRKKYSLTRTKFKNLIFEINYSGFNDI